MTVCSYCQLPITTARSHLGGVGSSAARPMPSDGDLAKLTQLAAIVAIALENVLDKAHPGASQLPAP